MAKEIFLEIDGKKVALTPEQIKVLELEEEKANPFARVEKNNRKEYFYINDIGAICSSTDSDFVEDMARHGVANYCTDAKILWQRKLHESLSRLLWRFSMENDGDKIRQYDRCYHIFFRKGNKSFGTTFDTNCLNEGTIYFYSEEIAQKAIDDIVLPFMRNHPDFVW